MDDDKQLVLIAKEEPQCAFAVYTKAIAFRWLYTQQTIPDTEHLFELLENSICQHLIPALVGRHGTPLKRTVLALPVRYVGMGLSNPVLTSSWEYKCSKEVTVLLVELILKQEN